MTPLGRSEFNSETCHSNGYGNESVGMKVWDATGNVMMTEADRITRVLGIVSTTSSSGSLTDARFADGQPWFAVQAPSYDAAGKMVTFSGTTMSWASSSFSANIVYGIY